MINLIFLFYFIFTVGLFVLLAVTINYNKNYDKDNLKIIEKKNNSSSPYRIKPPETKQEAPLPKQYWFEADGEKEYYFNGKEVLMNVSNDEDNIQMRIILPKIKIRQ